MDMRTKFFGVAALLCFALSVIATDSLKYVPFWLGVVYVVLTLACAADSMSRH